MADSSNLISPVASTHSSAPTGPYDRASFLFPHRAVNSHSLPLLKEELQTVAATRASDYVQKFAILLRWMDDNTHVDDDIATMANLMDQFGIQHETYSFGSTEKEPYLRWTLSDRIREIFTQCMTSEEDSLVVFYYAGHGQLINGDLHFGSGVETSVPWAHLKLDLMNDAHALRKIDVLVILDCCYAGAARRRRSERTTQVLAAYGPNETVNPRIPNTSFTQRLFRAAQNIRAQGSITAAALFQELQREREESQQIPPTPKPVMETLGGLRPIKLHFNTKCPASSSSSLSRCLGPLTEDRKVIVKLTLNGHRGEVDVFKRAVQDLPDIMKVQVIGAFETDESVFLILHMSWECWALWTMVADLEFIGNARGPSVHH